tara:strand:+ start:210836 stop:211558 length:723 start_codon:yes stop_codon:yes gene_type:complete
MSAVKSNPYNGLVKKHLLLTKAVVQDWLNMAKSIAEKYSQDPSTKTAALIISPQNELLSIGVNGLVPGIELPDDYDGDDPIWRQWRLDRTTHAEVASIVNAANKGVALKDAIMFSTFYPCSPCLVTTHGSQVQTIITDKNQLDPERVKRWKDSFDTAGSILIGAKHPQLSMFMTPLEKQVSPNLGFDQLHELNAIAARQALGFGFTQPIAYAELEDWGKGGVTRPAPQIRSVPLKKLGLG